MKFVQYYLDCLSQASYLIGDETTGRAAVVDPRRDVQDYLDDAAASGLSIDYVVETHVHADFLSGHLELAAATGATIVYGQAADVQFPHRQVADGERIQLGQVGLEFRATPRAHARVGLHRGVGVTRRERTEAAGTASRLTARQLAGARAAVPGLVLLDVRGPGEREMGCIEGSVHIPLGQLRDRVGELDPARPVVTYCPAATGRPSRPACSAPRASPTYPTSSAATRRGRRRPDRQ